MVIGNMVHQVIYRFGVTVIIIHCTFSKAIVIEEYSLSCECLERLDLGLNSGWVSFRARFIIFFFRFRRKMNPKKFLTGGGRSLTGAERARKFRAAHHTTADIRKLADKKITTRKLQAHHIQACAGR